MKYRPHGELLSESMAKVVEISPNKTALRKLLKKDAFKSIRVTPYCYDSRNKWDTYIVTVDGQAVGFTDGPIQE